MKKIILALFCLFLSTISYSQIGIKAGVNLASLKFEDDSQNFENLNENSIIGLAAGLFFTLPVTENFHLQPEVLFIQKGNKTTYEVSTLAQDFTTKTFYNYFEIPVLLKYRFGIDAAGVYLAAGPWAGLAFGGYTEIETNDNLLNTSSNIKDEFSFDDEDKRKRLDYGFSFGGGLDLAKIVLDLRYNLGVNNLLDEDANNNNDEKPILSTQGISATIGFKF